MTDDERAPPTLRSVLATMTEGIRTLEGQTVPGVGVITATALLAAVGDIHRFPTGRHFASFLGLTPNETSSGEQRRLGAISKRGDTDLRMLLVHGGRSALWSGKGRAARAAHWGASVAWYATSTQRPPSFEYVLVNCH